MSGLVWGAPHVLWFLLLIPTAIGLAIYGWWRRTRVEGGLFYRAKEMGLVVGDAAKWRVVRAATLTIGLSCLVLALARPQYGSRVRTIRKRGVDIVLCVDFSKSMNARDVRPSRIDRAKAEVARFASHLAGDRVAVIAFAGEPIEFPLTTDPAAVSLFLRDLRPDDMHVGGTAIGRALSAAKNVFARTNNQAHAADGEDPTAQRARVVVLLTDGEDHEGDPLQAAKELKEIGARVYTVGIGSRTGEPVPTYAPDGTMTGYLRDEDGNPVTTALTDAGENKLREIAQAADGKYFHAPRGGVGLESVEKEIRRMKQTELRARRVTVHEERYSLLLLPALLLLLLESLLPDALFGAAFLGRKKQLATAATVALLSVALPFVFTVRALAQQSAPSAATARPGMVESLRARLFRRANPEVERGNARLTANDTQGALAAYDTAARTLPSEAGVHLNRGLALAQANDQARARQAFLTAAQPNAPREVLSAAYYNLGRSFYTEAEARAGEEKHDEAQRLFREALDSYRRALRAAPGNRDTAYNLEVTLRRIREEEEKQRQKDEQKKQEQNEQQQDQQNQQPQDQQNQQNSQEQQNPQQNQDDNPPSQNQDPQQGQQPEQQNPGQQNQQNPQAEPQPQPQPQQGNANAQEEQPQPNSEEAEQAAPLSQEALQALDSLREGERPYQTERARSMGRRSPRRPTKDW